MKINMAWADFGPLEKKLVNQVIDSGWISRHEFIPRFELLVAALHGQKYGMMVNSGTDALRIGLATLKEVHRWRDGDEVIVPALTFVATANAVIQNSLKPVFVDVQRLTYNLDPGKIAERLGRRSVAIIPVHLFGLPADMPAIIKIARTHRLRVIEDSCETMFVHKIQGDMAAFSTYMAHMIQTGVGGVLTTNQARYDRISRSFMNHGRSANPDRFEFERIGYSSRVTEFEGALGCAQLTRWPEILKRRQDIALRIFNGLQTLPLQLPRISTLGSSSWMLFPVVLFYRSRDKFMSYMLKKGIETRQMMPLTNQATYQHLLKQKDYPVADWINKNGVCLPCHQKLTDKDVDYMVECVKGFFCG